MNKYIQKLISEQFNIGNMDLNNKKLKHNTNIFNKRIINPEEIYEIIINDTFDNRNKLLNENPLEDWKITAMNDFISVIKPNNTYSDDSLYYDYDDYDYNEHDDEEELTDFNKVIIYYSEYYPNESLNWLDVTDITDMSSIFSGKISCGCQINNNFNGDISKWNVSNVTDMNRMFNYSEFNQDISEWDVSHVTNMEYMFCCSKFNGDISKWDVSNVKDMKCMFNKSAFNQDISGWDVSHVTDMEYMFCCSKFNGDISKWDVSNVKDMKCMFNKSAFNCNISIWNVSKVIYYAGIFKNCHIIQEYIPRKFKKIKNEQVYTETD